MARIDINKLIKHHNDIRIKALIMNYSVMEISDRQEQEEYNKLPLFGKIVLKLWGYKHAKN